jgi:demethylmenaquinone methyltransferase/2-methoxy-6-polyprenyl-1,4-benzoquinol methylase
MYTKDKKFISGMFDEISPTYDKLNHLFSARRDLSWRRKAIEQLKNQNTVFNNILDLAAGSGDLGVEFLKLNPQKLFSADISPKMLGINKQKLNDSRNCTILAEAENLPFENDFFDVCGIAFGIRNFERLENCLVEINRVLKNGGKLVIIEMFRPERKKVLNRMFNFYFSRLMPVAGNKLAKSNYAYQYLLSSVYTFISVNEYSSMLYETGFNVNYVKNNFIDVVYTVIAEKI